MNISDVMTSKIMVFFVIFFLLMSIVNAQDNTTTTIETTTILTTTTNSTTTSTINETTTIYTTTTVNPEPTTTISLTTTTTLLETTTIEEFTTTTIPETTTTIEETTTSSTSSITTTSSSTTTSSTTTTSTTTSSTTTIPIEITYGLSIVIDTTANETRMDVEVPQGLLNSSFQSGYNPRVAFLAVSRISTERGDEIRIVSVCKNEGDESGDGKCSLKISDGNSIVYDKCENNKDINGGINAGNGVTVCKSSFVVESDDLYLIPYTYNGSSENGLIFRIPVNGIRNGIVTVFNNPSLEKENDLSKIPYHHPLINDDSASVDYGNYNWILTRLKGVKDQKNEGITKYVVNTKSFLHGEGVLVYTSLNKAGIPIYVSLFDENNIKIQENNVVNPGFEMKGLTGWKVDKGTWILSSEKHTGSNGIHTSSSNKENDYYIHQDVFVNPNVQYNVSGWIRTNNVDKSGNGGTIQSIVRNGSDNDISGTNTFLGNLDRTNNWKYFSRVINTTKDGSYIRFWTQLHKASGDVWFDDMSIAEISDSEWRIGGKIMWLSVGNSTNYTIKINAEDSTESKLLKVEPELELKYSDEKAYTSGIIAGEDVVVKKTLSIESKSGERVQVINMSVDIDNPKDYVEDSCHTEDVSCWESFVVDPGVSVDKKIEWKENGVEIKEISERQNVNKQSTPEEQYLMKVVELTNTNSKRNFTDVKAAVFMDGTCSNKKDYSKMDWIPSDMRTDYCYLHLDRLDSGESETVDISYYGDWVDVECGEVKQDMSKQSILDVQYLVKECELKSEKKISWKNILVKTNMPGNCSDCVQNVSVVRPVLWLSFDEGEGNVTKDGSGFSNDGILKPNVTNGPKWVDGKYGNALEFDGTDDYVDLGNTLFDNYNGFTISTWVYWNEKVSHDEYILEKNDVLQLDLNSNIIRFRIRNSMNDWHICDRITTLNSNEWMLISTTFGNGIARVYLNEQQIGNDCSVVGSMDDASNVYIGKHHIGKTSYFNGIIDEVHIYNRDLSEEEIKSLYEVESTDHYRTTFHSIVGWINYTIEEPRKVEVVNDTQLWSQIIILNKTFDIDLFNISVSIPTNLEVEPNSLNCSENITDLSFKNSQVSFVIPKLDKIGNIYEIKFSTELSTENSSTKEEQSPMTGMLINVLKTFLANPISEYIIIVNLICVFVIISYFIHIRGKK